MMSAQVKVDVFYSTFQLINEQNVQFHKTWLLGKLH